MKIFYNLRVFMRERNFFFSQLGATNALLYFQVVSVVKLSNTFTVYPKIEPSETTVLKAVIHPVNICIIAALPNIIAKDITTSAGCH